MNVSKTNTSFLVIGFRTHNGRSLVTLLRIKGKDSQTSNEWRIPGRNIFLGETPKSAAEREFHKRTGFNLLNTEVVQVVKKKIKTIKK